MKQTIKKKKLEEMLQQLSPIINFKFELDQYQTSPKVASLFLHNINQNYGFEDKIVVELGCGSGILGIGALLCDAK